MENIAADNSHGYCNNGKREDMFGKTNGQYNCIGLVIMGWYNNSVQSININKDKVGFTSIKKDLSKAGFIDVTNQVSLYDGKNMKRGDILIRTYKINGSYHIAQFCGNGYMVHACEETKSNPGPGDASGLEIFKQPYGKENGYHFNLVYRYVGK